jgi:hypothetical protein
MWVHISLLPLSWDTQNNNNNLDRIISWYWCLTCSKIQKFLHRLMKLFIVEQVECIQCLDLVDILRLLLIWFIWYVLHTTMHICIKSRCKDISINITNQSYYAQSHNNTFAVWNIYPTWQSGFNSQLWQGLYSLPYVQFLSTEWIVEALSWGVKQPQHEADNTHPPSFKV